MRKRLAVLPAGLLLTAALLFVAVASNADSPPPRGNVVVFVTSQGLYFDSVVNGPLPPQGPFQILKQGTNGLETDFGPGDPGYLGGRWKMDADGDGVFDTYFSCPLLPPGRATP